MSSLARSFALPTGLDSGLHLSRSSARGHLLRATSGGVSGVRLSGAGAVRSTRRRGLPRWQGTDGVRAGSFDPSPGGGGSMLSRLRSTEIARTASANLSGALTMSNLFAGQGVLPAPWDSDDGSSGETNTTGATNLTAPAASSDRGQDFSAPHSPRSPRGSFLNPLHRPDAIVNSAYIDGTMAPGGAFSVDGRLIDVSQASMRPSASHGFDRVLSGAAAGFQDVLEASAEAARAAYVVFVDEGCPSVLEVRELWGMQSQDIFRLHVDILQNLQFLTN